MSGRLLQSHCPPITTIAQLLRLAASCCMCQRAYCERQPNISRRSAVMTQVWVVRPSVVRPSCVVEHVFSKTVKRISAVFVEKYLSTMSPDHFIYNSNDISSESTQLIHPREIMHSHREDLYPQIVKLISNCCFLFFFVLINMEPIQESKFQTAPLKVHAKFISQNQRVVQERVYHKRLKEVFIFFHILSYLKS